MKHLKNPLLILFGCVVLNSCCSFDKEKASEMFQNHNPDFNIISATEYECSGTACECWYINFRYTKVESQIIKDTTVQFWVGKNAFIIVKSWVGCVYQKKASGKAKKKHTALTQFNSRMYWKNKHIKFSDLPKEIYINFDWKETDYKKLDFSNTRYLIIWHHQSKEKDFRNLPDIENLEYLEINWSSSTSLIGLEKYKNLWLWWNRQYWFYSTIEGPWGFSIC